MNRKYIAIILVLIAILLTTGTVGAAPLFDEPNPETPDDEWREHANNLYQQLRPAMVLIQAYDESGFGGWHGSGFLISEDGYIVTVAHNVEFAETLDILLYGEIYNPRPASVIASNPEQDVALIKIEGANFPYVEFGNSDTLQTDVMLMAIGHPGALRWVATVGEFLEMRDDLLMSKVPGTSGLSGGAVFNMDGQVVGLFAGRMPEEDIDFFAPSSFDVLDDLCYSLEPEDSYAVPGNIVLEIIQPFLDQ